MANEDLVEDGQRPSERDSKSPGDALGGFPCPEDITVRPYVATYSEVGRGSLCRIPPLDPSLRWVNDGEFSWLVNSEGEVVYSRPCVADEERIERNRNRAERRAKRRVEDFMVHNEITKMWTLTYAEKCWSRTRCVADIHAFMIEWKKYEHGRAFPYVWVIEQHKDGSFHVHLGVRGDHHTDFFALKRLWGKGRIRFDAQRKSRDGSKRSIQRMAHYLTKYLTKTFDDARDSGTHRYEVAEGFQPGTETQHFATHLDAVAWLMQKNSQLRCVWFSGDNPKWDASWPCWCFEDG